MAVQLRLSELTDALQWAGASPDNAAYVELGSGKIWLVGDWEDEDDPPPDDVGDKSLYIEVPGQAGLGLGRRLAQRFAREHAPQLDEQVHHCFARQGAYGRYKDLLHRHGLLQAWYDYEAAAIEEALREWAADRGITLVEGAP